MMKSLFFVLIFGFFFLEASAFEDWNEDLCNEGSMPNCANLGYLYQSAQGVERDLAKAKFFYQKACDGGYQPACIAHESLKEEDPRAVN